jgi:hypothetical protein
LTREETLFLAGIRFRDLEHACTDDDGYDEHSCDARSADAAVMGVLLNLHILAQVCAVS